jgi:hypothetical protein
MHNNHCHRATAHLQLNILLLLLLLLLLLNKGLLKMSDHTFILLRDQWPSALMPWHSVEGISVILPMNQNGLPYFLVCRILSLTDKTATDGNSGTVCMSHTLETQGLLIMIYIQNVVNSLNAKLNLICHLLALLGAHCILHISRIWVNLIASFIQQYKLLSSIVNFGVHFLL